MVKKRKKRSTVPQAPGRSHTWAATRKLLQHGPVESPLVSGYLSSSSKENATAAFADSRTVLPSTSATRPSLM
jgi:hypothetical protein